MLKTWMNKSYKEKPAAPQVHSCTETVTYKKILFVSLCVVVIVGEEQGREVVLLFGPGPIC